MQHLMSIVGMSLEDFMTTLTGKETCASAALPVPRVTAIIAARAAAHLASVGEGARGRGCGVRYSCCRMHASAKHVTSMRLMNHPNLKAA